jgi:hypothetical protein
LVWCTRLARPSAGPNGRLRGPPRRCGLHARSRGDIPEERLCASPSSDGSGPDPSPVRPQSATSLLRSSFTASSTVFVTLCGALPSAHACSASHCKRRKRYVHLLRTSPAPFVCVCPTLVYSPGPGGAEMTEGRHRHAPAMYAAHSSSMCLERASSAWDQPHFACWALSRWRPSLPSSRTSQATIR